ncbi:probable sodium/potassium/calcium exchanger CG1090 isoform X4 [Cherax quadricarinatus]|uniref:probable sodium/potassium/calcium exchanger CG1090 isoform X4 n=1 Tax=Cherax quadricarinatus TaxID=27406 RepID=UPI00387E4E83
MGLAARLGMRTRRARLRPLLLATFTYLGLVTLLTHGHTLLRHPGESVAPEAEASSAGLVSRHLLQDDEENYSSSSPSSPPQENCTLPAIEQFPRGFMSPSARKSGGLIVHIIITIYMFVGIAIVCDEYFVPSLEMICDGLHLSEDVAGATFMAAGSSAPELATSVIAVFVAKDDIGISGVIGSAVFNIMFVISVCALFSGRVININWWPLIRDSTYYCLAIFALLLTIYDEEVTWYESTFLLLLYLLYIVMMWNNSRLEVWANTLNVPFKNATQGEKSTLFGTKPVPPMGDPGLVKDPTDPNNPELGQQDTSPLVMSYGATDGEGMPKQVEPAEVEAAPTRSMAPEMKDDDVSPWTVPVGICERINWALSLPLVALHHFTTPDCRRERFRRWHLITFIMSMIWIAAYSYVMVWMITIIGFTLGIPDTVMGLTLIAVGVSAPDALSSLCVAKQGFGDMAVSNAIGSNVFDILLCLGFPWFLKTAVIYPGTIVPVESRGLTYSTISLFSTVIFLIIATHMNGWKLDKKYGVVLMFWYLIFMVFASLYELNVFGYLNPPECSSPY